MSLCGKHELHRKVFSAFFNPARYREAIKAISLILGVKIEVLVGERGARCPTGRTPTPTPN